MSRRNSGAAACHVCRHREHAAIDLAIASGVSLAALSKRYAIGSDSLYRHRRSHLSPQLRARLLAGPSTDIDLDRLRDSEGQSLLANIVHIRRRLLASLDVAEEAGDCNLLCRVTGQLHQNLELVGKLLGPLGKGSVDILLLPQWTEVRTGLIDALAGYPEARLAVSGLIARIESKAAADITADAQRPMFDISPSKTTEPA